MINRITFRLANHNPAVLEGSDLKQDYLYKLGRRHGDAQAYLFSELDVEKDLGGSHLSISRLHLGMFFHGHGLTVNDAGSVYGTKYSKEGHTFEIDGNGLSLLAGEHDLIIGKNIPLKISLA